MRIRLVKREDERREGLSPRELNAVCCLADVAYDTIVNECNDMECEHFSDCLTDIVTEAGGKDGVKIVCDLLLHCDREGLASVIAEFIPDDREKERAFVNRFAAGVVLDMLEDEEFIENLAEAIGVDLEWDEPKCCKNYKGCDRYEPCDSDM